LAEIISLVQGEAWPRIAATGVKAPNQGKTGSNFGLRRSLHTEMMPKTSQRRLVYPEINVAADFLIGWIGRFGSKQRRTPDDGQGWVLTLALTLALT
jgi:hypothetical protein